MREIDFIEESARTYLKGEIKIHDVILFTKYKSEGKTSYHTYKGAFMFPVSGNCDICFDGICYNACPGMMIHGCPGKELSFEVKGNEPFKYINLYYDTDRQLLFKYEPQNIDYIIGLLYKLIKFSHAFADDHKAEINSIISGVFDSIYKDYLIPEIRSDIELVNEAALYINEHYMLNLSLESIASEFGKTSNQLSYLFYKYKKIRPIQYLISCRLSAACSLLTTTSFSVNKIAKEVGYKDFLFFSRIFKRHYGYSPREFRSLYK